MTSDPLVGRVEFPQPNIEVAERLEKRKRNASRLWRQNENGAIRKMLVSRRLIQTFAPIFHLRLERGEAEAFKCQCVKVFRIWTLFPCKKKDIGTTKPFHSKFSPGSPFPSVLSLEFRSQKGTLEFGEKIRFRPLRGVRKVFSRILAVESESLNWLRGGLGHRRFSNGKVILRRASGERFMFPCYFDLPLQLADEA